MKRHGARLSIIALALAVLLTTAAPARPARAWVHPGLQTSSPTAFWVVMRQRAALDRAALPAERAARGQAVVSALQSTASRSQGPLLRWLDARGTPYQSFWAANAVRVEGGAALIAKVAARPDVLQILPDEDLPLIDAEPPTPAAPQNHGDGAGADPSLGWNLNIVSAPQVWSAYQTRGEGIVVATLDSGVQYDHPALARHYRGWRAGGTYDHAYNWFDPTGVCPTAAPCDNNSHGTHVMGIMVGETPDGSVTTGVAPGATWIAAKACGGTSCALAHILAAGQWMLAPTDAAGENPRPDLRPDIINNSWGETGASLVYQDMIRAWAAAGMLPVFAAGNYGSACGDVMVPASYAESVAVGATQADDTIMSGSRMGPSPVTGQTKPDLAAPGAGIRSTVPEAVIPGGYGEKSGTSMAAPHVSGGVALLWAAAPAVRGNLPATRDALGFGAADHAPTRCAGTDELNNQYGHGRLDTGAAILWALNPHPVVEFRLLFPFFPVGQP